MVDVQEHVRRCLPQNLLASGRGGEFAYGFLAAAVLAYLDGQRSEAWIRAAITELDAALANAPRPAEARTAALLSRWDAAESGGEAA